MRIVDPGVVGGVVTRQRHAAERRQYPTTMHNTSTACLLRHATTWTVYALAMDTRKQETAHLTRLVKDGVGDVIFSPGVVEPVR